MTTIQFDVGGTVYKVSKSLLEKFPGSLLERCASKTWNEGGEEEFIEGDGIRFRQVLDYMRHGEVTLPKGESTPSFLKELEFYGIEYDKDKIMNSDDIYLPKIEKIVTCITEANQQKKLEFLVSTIATDAMKKAGIHIFSNKVLSDGKTELTITYGNFSARNVTIPREEYFVAELLMKQRFDRNIVIKMVNGIIARTGLVITTMGRDGDYAFFVKIGFLSHASNKVIRR